MRRPKRSNQLGRSDPTYRDGAGLHLRQPNVAAFHLRESATRKQHAEIREQSSIIAQQPLDQAGHAVRVTVIKGGKSVNGYSYDAQALRAIAQMLEGAHAYADHARSGADEMTRSVRDVVGFYHDAAYIAPTPGEPSGRVDATLHIMEAADWLWSLIQEACALGRPDFIGLSIDIFGQWQQNAATKAKEVTHVVSLNSCDVVTRPSAGGTFKRILHDTIQPSPQHPPQGREQGASIMPDTHPDPHGEAGGRRSSLVDGSHEGTIPEGRSELPYSDTSDSIPIHSHVVDYHTKDYHPLDSHVSDSHPINYQPSNYMVVKSHPADSHPADYHVVDSHPVNSHPSYRHPSNSQPIDYLTADSLNRGNATGGGQIMEQSTLEQQRLEAEQLLAQVRLERAALLLERRLQESILPSAVKEQIKGRYSGRIFEERELEQELSASLGMMAQLARDGIVRGHSYEKPDIGSQITEAEKIQASFDAMFGLEVDSARLGNIRGFSSIREAYARVTGDATLLGGITSNTTLGNIRVSENAPIGRITEADTTTASFSFLLGTSMNKRLLKDYQAWPSEWSRFVSIAPIRDFKQQTRVRLGAFGSLPIVAEDTPYTAVTLTDSAATYVPQKRGNLVTVSREAIINDDLQAIKQIPTKLAVAAAYTLAEFVYSFLSGNPNIYDSSPLFTTGAPHNNLGSSALSTAAMQAGVTAMREQTNYAGKRLGLRPRYLVVPPELEFTAMVVTKSAGVPGSNGNDINPMLGFVQPIVSPQLTSPTQWFLIGDPREIDTIEIGFVGGQVSPILMVQDSPMLGLNFTQDAISLN